MVFSILQVKHYKERASKEGLHYNLNQMEERRAKAHLRMLAYKNAVARLHNQKVHSQPIKVRNLVLRKTMVIYKDQMGLHERDNDNDLMSSNAPPKKTFQLPELEAGQHFKIPRRSTINEHKKHRGIAWKEVNGLRSHHLQHDSSTPHNDEASVLTSC
ncbi:hypothetical protein B296_00025021 [Ensete ventricosum]|uniref:Uncharacterized protein n=1 Tax=Ensete ventricosum TaxID=4639 RepID=A0A426ZKI9_ENSVE|nr:hypothetical protein B296_00025021 [Ensete ventricosum]